jgi:Plasmid pRiA4b ORF-3-like protein
MHDGGMPKPIASPEPVVYQLRVVLHAVSPLIWRRLLIRSDTTIAEMHATLQTTLGWSDEHLNRFVIHGREYGVSHLGGIGFRDDPQRVRLVDVGLRVGERFLYEYDFTDGWQHVVRLERIVPLQPQGRYPVCIGGRRAVPPEDCGGPWAFLELRQRYSIISIADQLMQLVERRLIIGAQAFVQDHYEDVMQLLRWLEIDRFDRRKVNRRLAEHAVVAHVRSAA